MKKNNQTSKLSQKKCFYPVILFFATGCIVILCALFLNPMAKEAVPLDDKQRHWLVENINEFNQRSSPSVFLDEKNGETNRLYSPVGLYYALSMLYECADMDQPTRKEIETALQPSQSGIQSQWCNALYNSLVHNTRKGKLTMHNAIAMSNGFSLPQPIKNTITTEYYGKITKLTPAIQQEIENANGQMVIQNSLSFEGKWALPFEKDEITTDSFTCTDGTKLDWTFLNRTYTNSQFVQTELFGAGALYFNENYTIHFILPNEGFSITTLLQQPDTFKLALDYTTSNNEHLYEGKIHFKVPKVRFEATLDLNDTLKTLGIQQAYAGGFSALNQSHIQPMYLDTVKQKTFFELDENGARAKAYTWGSSMAASAERPQEDPELYLYLTRPFLLAVTSPDGVVLFTGVVYNPSE